MNVLKAGFEKKRDSSLVIPNVNLNELFIDGAWEYFKKNNVKVLLNKRVTKILIDEKVKEIVLEDGNKYTLIIMFLQYRFLLSKNYLRKRFILKTILKPNF